MAETGRLAGRIALITGASRGIGAAVARRFAAEGAHLILTARTQGALEELDDEIRAAGHGEPTLLPADLTEPEIIDQMGAAIFERFARLDILVGNAAMLGSLSPLGHMAPYLWDQVIALNLTVNWRLLRSLDPLLRASDGGRAIFVSSTVGSEPRAYWGAYAVSKAGLEQMVKIYAAENQNTQVKANLINPGPTRTTMRAQAFPGENPEKIKTPEDTTDLFVDLASAECAINGEIVSPS